MRITNNILINNMIRNISNNLSAMSKYQYQMATGKKIELPSDDPVVAARALKLRTDLSEIDQYKRNATDAQSWLDITESTLSSMGDILQRCNELAVKGSDGTNTTSDMQNISDEIKQLKEQMISLANTTYAGRYIFSGYKTDQKLVKDDGSFNINVSNSERINYEVGIGEDINVNIPGWDLFNNGSDTTTDPLNRGSMFKDFDDFITALDTGNQDGVDAMIGKMKQNMDNVLRIRSDIGAKTNRIELTINRIDSDNENFTKLMSDNEDVDMAETLINLKNQENVYNSSLAGGARIIQPTLMDFLK